MRRRETGYGINGIIDEIHAERQRQDEKWGGPDHDDQHSPSDWVRWIKAYASWALMMWECNSPQKFRRMMLQVAALAVAACEAYDRNIERGKDA